MQNEYVIMPWDSIHQTNIWYNTEFIENDVSCIPTKNDSFGFTLEIAIIALLIYNFILICALNIKNENLLYRKNKTIKKR